MPVAGCSLGMDGLGALQGRLHVPSVGQDGPGAIGWFAPGDLEPGPDPSRPPPASASPYTEPLRVGTPFW